MEVTEDFLDFLEEGALAVEVWGHRRSGFNELMAAPASDEVEALRHKSFPERLAVGLAMVVRCRNSY